MTRGVFPGKGWWALQARTDGVALGDRKLYAEKIGEWCSENIGEAGVDWWGGGYSCIFRVKSEHVEWFMLTWG